MRIFNILIMFLLYTHSKETGEIEGEKIFIVSSGFLVTEG